MESLNPEKEDVLCKNVTGPNKSMKEAQKRIYSGKVTPSGTGRLNFNVYVFGVVGLRNNRSKSKEMSRLLEDCMEYKMNKKNE